MLTEEEFLAVVARSPLVSIDLVVRDLQGHLLLGLRTNEPAKGSWFVPGGRIRKGETLDDAFVRITAAELGVPLPRSAARLFGAFTHQYETNFKSAANVSTHYVVLAYELVNPSLPAALPRAQHSEFRWWSEADAISSDGVHPNNLPYFAQSRQESMPSASSVWLAQYEALNNRRNSFNQLMWQTPTLSLTAQAFLFSIVFAKDVSWKAQLLTATLALASAVASLILLAKHRGGEVDMAKRLEQMESEGCFPHINAKMIESSAPWYVRMSSYKLWIILLSLFGVASTLAIARVLYNLYRAVAGGV